MKYILDEVMQKLNTTGYSIYQFGTDKIEDCVVYQMECMYSDKIKEQYRLNLTVIATDYEIALKMLADIKLVMLTLGDKKASDNILEISQNGGGTLENLATNTYHFKANFILKTRYREEI